MPVGFQEGPDVLEEIELFVARGDPEVLAVVSEVLGILLALLVGEGRAGLLAEGVDLTLA
jgi:hypothetical protein